MTIEDMIRAGVEALDEQWQDPDTDDDYNRFLERAEQDNTPTSAPPEQPETAEQPAEDQPRDTTTAGHRQGKGTRIYPFLMGIGRPGGRSVRHDAGRASGEPQPDDVLDTEAPHVASYGGATDGQVRTMIELARQLRAIDQADEAAALAAEALELGGERGDHAGMALAAILVGCLHFERNELPEARAALTRAVATMRQLGDRRGLAVALSNLGAVLDSEGLHREAVDTLRESLHLQRQERTTAGSQRAGAESDWATALNSPRGQSCALPLRHGEPGAPAFVIFGVPRPPL